MTTQLDQAKAQRDALVEKRTGIAAQLASHQANSTAELDKLKAELQALQRRESQKFANGAPHTGSPADAFSERARNQVEHALAMDQEYQTQLTQLDDELRRVDANIAAIRGEMESLRIEKRK